MFYRIRSIIMASLMLGGISSIAADNSNDFLTLYGRNFLSKPAPALESVTPVVEVVSRSSRVSRMAAGLWKYLKNPHGDVASFPVTQEEVHTIIAHQLYNVLRKDETSVIKPSTYKDLDILHNDADADCTLFSALKTNTACGKLYSAFLLANPTANIDVLEKRQEIIRFLVGHQEVCEELQTLLEELAEHETMIADFYKSDANREYCIRVLGGLYWGKIFPFLDFMDDSLVLDNATYMYDYAKVPFVWLGIEPVQLLNRTIAGNMFTFNFFNRYFIFKGFLDNLQSSYTTDKMSTMGTLFVLNNLTEPSFLWNDMKQHFSAADDSGIDKYVYLRWAGMLSWSVWGTVHALAHKNRVLDLVHKKMNKVAILVKALKKFSSTLQSHLELNNNLESSSRVHALFGGNSDVSPKLKELLELLETNTFTTESKWALRGRVKMAYHLFDQVKSELNDAFVAIGEIDTFVSAAQMFKKHEKTATPFTFAVYEKNANTALLVLHDMWNPLIPHEQVVANSATLGFEGLPRNMILTGPNAGGKTTFLKGAVSAVIFAQTFGIAPARFIQLTPFGKINTYISIVDNIAAGQSLFMAEIARVSELVKNTQENDNNGIFTLSIIDELFTGTSPDQGKAASYAIAKKLGGITTSVVLISSHFVDTMSKLEGDTGLFKNYKVTAEFLPDGGLYYPFTVVPGVSSINVVDAILRKGGFGEDVMQDFEDQLAGF